jgi:hypothetical protein
MDVLDKLLHRSDEQVFFSHTDAALLLFLITIFTLIYFYFKFQLFSFIVFPFIFFAFIFFSFCFYLQLIACLHLFMDQRSELRVNS